MKDICDQILIDLHLALSQPRLDHILSVAKTVKSLAKAYQRDPEKLYLCALLHDLAREMPVKEQVRILNEGGVKDLLLLENPALCHAKVAGILAVERYNLNSAVIEPVIWHTTGRKNMTLDDCLLYVADQIEPKRSWSSKEIIEEAHQNIYKTMQECLRKKLEFTLKRGKMVHPDSLECWNWLCLQH